MAIAEITTQRASGGSGSDHSLAYPADVTAGNLLICAGSIWRGAGTQAPTIADTQVNSWTLVGSTNLTTWGGGENQTYIAYAIAGSSAANTVTVTPHAGSDFTNMAITEFSGNNATPADVNGGDSAGSGTTASDSITPGVDDALIIAVCNCQNGTITPNASWTQIAEDEGSSVSPYNLMRLIISGSPSAQTPDWTVPSGEWVAQTHSFKPVAVAAGSILLFVARDMENIADIKDMRG
jgi:hypothetical protein